MYVEIDTFFGLSQVAITSKFEEFSIFAPSSISRFFFKYSTTKKVKNSQICEKTAYVSCDNRSDRILSMSKSVRPKSHFSQMKLIENKQNCAMWMEESTKDRNWLAPESPSNSGKFFQNCEIVKLFTDLLFCIGYLRCLSFQVPKARKCLTKSDDGGSNC